MSLDLYSTALVWHAQRGGVAKLWGKLVKLLEAPPLMGLQLVAVEYFPEVGQRELQESTGRRRDMTQAEVEAADAFLLAVTER